MKYIILISILISIGLADSDKKLYETLKNMKDDLSKVSKNEKVNKVKIEKIKEDSNITKVQKKVLSIIKKDKKIKSKIKQDEKILVKDQ